MPNFFLSSWWPGVLLWGVLYVLDYAMTIRCARLYRAGACEKIVFEGSFELTPIFQPDIDRLRVVSPRFLALLVLYATMIAIIWTLAVPAQPEFYILLLGAMIGSQLAVHTRHLSNSVMFRMVLANECVKGRIEYSRSFMLRMSALQMLALGLMFGVVAALTASWFVAGAALSCVSIAWKHFTWARKQVAAVQEKANAVGMG